MQWQWLRLLCNKSSIKSLTGDPFWWNIQAYNLKLHCQFEKNSIRCQETLFPSPLLSQSSIRCTLFKSWAFCPFRPFSHHMMSSLKGDPIRPLTAQCCYSVTLVVKFSSVCHILGIYATLRTNIIHKYKSQGLGWFWVVSAALEKRVYASKTTAFMHKSTVRFLATYSMLPSRQDLFQGHPWILSEHTAKVLND